MPGPKPNARLVWRDLNRVTKRLFHACDTDEQRQVVTNLIRGLRKVEHLWGIVTPFEVGRADFTTGRRGFVENPYPKGSTDAEQRDEGYRQAVLASLPAANSAANSGE